MRKLFPIPVLVCLLAVPAALGAPGGSAPGGNPALITSSLGHDPLDGAEARGRLHAAEKRAVKDARREATARRAARRKARRDAAPAQAAGSGAAATGPAVATPPHLQSIAACESGGNPQAVSAGGQYRGKYQFSPATWQAVGGSGDPAAAPEAEQDRRAAMLYAQSGAGQWPVCGG